MLAQSGGAAEYTDCISAGDGDLGNVEYPFTAIAPKSTLVRSGSTW